MTPAVLTQYLPQDRLAALTAGRDLPERVGGAALFADLSGFTTLAETLDHALGPQRGTEELGSLLNRVYETLLTQVERYSGAIIGFSGDGFTAWFEGDDGLRAVACALLMQRQMPSVAGLRLPDGRLVSCDLKVAAAAGPARRLLVGDPAIQVLEVLAGHTVALLAAAERLARPGEVLLDSATAARLLTRVRVTGRRGGSDTYAVVGGLYGSGPPRSWATAQATALSFEQVQPWLPAAVYARWQQGERGVFAELRPTVALFLRFGDLAYDTDESAGRRLDSYIRWVQGVLARYEGVLIDLTLGDKGSYLYASFGIPVAHGDDATRAMMAALELRDLPPALAGPSPGSGHTLGPVQIGLHAGPTYTGVFGSAGRRTYGVIGPAVNLASRLMQAAAPGTILVSAALARQAAGRYELRPLSSPIRVKGRVAPLAVCRLERRWAGAGALPAAGHAGWPLVGRQAELAQAWAALEAAQTAQGQVLGIVGAPGLGKSRLVAEVARRAQEAGMLGYGGTAASYGTSIPYLAWRTIWQALLDLDATAPLPIQQGQVERAVHDLAPDHLAHLPLLGPLLDLPWPDTALTQSMSADQRKQALDGLLVACLRRLAQRAPRLIVIEDAHWLDALSHDLLLTVGQAIHDLPVLLVVAYRPPEIARLQAPHVMGLPHSTEITLAALAPAEAAEWAGLQLAARFGAEQPAPAPLIARLVAQSEGNPFYIEELVGYLADRGMDLATAGAATLAWPSSVAHLILARIDRLSARHQWVLQIASIVGQVFPVAWLAGVDPDLGPADQVRLILGELAQHDLLLLERPEPDPAYRFKHLIVQQVIYDRLPYHTRAVLHERLAAWLESRFADAPPLDLLAFHYEHSEQPAKQYEYYVKAGQAAAAMYANAAAVSYYEQALAHPAADRGAVLLDLGTVLARMSNWAAAAIRYEAAYAQAVAQNDSAARGRAALGIGVARRNQGAYAEAAAWLGQAAAAFEQAGDGGSTAQALADQGRVHWLRGDYAEAQRVLEDSRARARAAADRRSEATALHNLGIVAYMQGDYATAAAHYSAALVLRQALGDRAGVAAILNNQAMVAAAQGDQRRATLLYEECLTLQREVGDRAGIATIHNNLGSMAYERGGYAAAQEHYAASLAIQRGLGGRRYIANILNNLGQVAAARGDYAAARALQVESLALHRALGNRRGIALVFTDLGALLAMQGDGPAARAQLAEAVALLRDLGDRAGQVLALTELVHVTHALADLPAACTALIEALDLCAPFGSWPTLRVLAATAILLPPGAIAARLLGAVAGLLAAQDLALPPAEREATAQAAVCAANLGPAAYQAAFAAGQRLSPAQALATARAAL